MLHATQNSTYFDVRDLTGVLAAGGLTGCLSALCCAVFDNDVKDWVVDVSVNDVYMNGSLLHVRDRETF
jgi:hypothetical protein